MIILLNTVFTTIKYQIILKIGNLGKNRSSPCITGNSCALSMDLTPVYGYLPKPGSSCLQASMVSLGMVGKGLLGSGPCARPCMIGVSQSRVKS